MGTEDVPNLDDEPKDALARVHGAYEAFGGRLDTFSVQFCYALIAANWAVFQSTAGILGNGLAKWSMSLALCTLVLNLFGTFILTELLARRVEYAERDPERWTKEFNANRTSTLWPYTVAIQRSSDVLRAFKVGLPFLGGVLLIIAVSGAGRGEDPPPAKAIATADTITVLAPRVEALLDGLVRGPRPPAPASPWSEAWPIVGMLGLSGLLFLLVRSRGAAPRAPAFLLTALLLLLGGRFTTNLEQRNTIELGGPPPERTRTTWTMDAAGRLGSPCVLRPFATGWDTLQPDADTSGFNACIAHVRAALHSDSLLELRITGAVDERPLAGTARARFGENASLALARAQWMVRYLAAHLSPEEQAVLHRKVQLVDQGAEHHAVRSDPAALALDRAVVVQPLWFAARTSARTEEGPPPPDADACPCLRRWTPCILHVLALVSAIATLVVLLKGKGQPPDPGTAKGDAAGAKEGGETPSPL